MLYSKTPEDRQISFFRSILGRVLVGEKSYKNLVDPVIIDARDLALGRKNYYTIDRGSYHIIVQLVKRDTNFLSNLDPDGLAFEDYQYIDNLLSSQRQFSLV